MFDHKHYLPILKGREGEYRALRALIPDVRDALTPLLEVPPIPWDYEQQTPEKTIDTHLRKVGQKIDRAWGPDRDIYIDLLWISEAERMDGGGHPLSFVFEAARERGINAIPVTGLLRGPDYLAACRDIISEDGRGVCIRVQREDFAEFDHIESTLRQTMNYLNVEVRDADLLLDLRALTPAERYVDANAVLSLVTRLPAITEWRTFTVAATSFPQNLIGLPPSDTSLLARQEWDLWTAICRHRPTLRRLPTFGDYAISHPEPSEVDPRVMRASASIRYTCDAAWLVLKGRNLRDHGYKQFHQVCRDLVRRSEYSGCEFSWGDAYIDDCAAERVGTGNLTTWRQVGTSHHLAFAARQLANHFGS